MINNEKGYTKKQVAEILHIAESTVYLFANQGKIKTLPNPHKILPEAQYDKESVEQLRKDLKIDEIDGLTISKFAKEINVLHGKVYNLIRKHQLEVILVPRGDTRKQYLLPQNTQKKLKEMLNNPSFKKGTRSDFYSHAKDIALYQAFVGANGNKYRVSRKDASKWGFHLQTGEWLDFDKAVQIYQLQPMYKIHQKTVRNIGNAHFVIPKIAGDLYEYIDFVYRTWGIENCALNERGDNVYLTLKSGYWKAVDYTPYDMFEKNLHQYIEIGSIEYSDGFYIVEGDTKRTTIDLSMDLYKILMAYADAEDMSLRDVVEDALREKFKGFSSK